MIEGRCWAVSMHKSAEGVDQVLADIEPLQRQPLFFILFCIALFGNGISEAHQKVQLAGRRSFEDILATTRSRSTPLAEAKVIRKRHGQALSGK